MDYHKILTEEGLLPLQNLKSFKMMHYKPRSDKERKKTYNKIRVKVTDSQKHLISGIYIYEKDGKILYVGKAKELYDRIKSHYIESFQEVSGDTKANTWHAFFSKYRGEVNIYWVRIDEETDRKITELMYQNFFNPIFEEFRIKHEALWKAKNSPKS